MIFHSPLLPDFETEENALIVSDPATGETLARLPQQGERETIAAIEAAQAALHDEYPPEARRAWLQNIHDLLMQNRDELARLITRENGKPLAEAKAEVEYSAGFFKFFASQLSHLEVESLGEFKNLQWKVHHRAAGVVALITPWNFPLAMLSKKLAPALAAGCSAVIKPAEATPLSALALLEIVQRAGVPKGKVHVVVGPPETIGGVLCCHPAIRLLSFTGSTAVGRTLIAQTAPHIKRLAMELGGNAPFIVFPSADIEAAADGLMASKFRCAGQTCVCANRVYVAREIENEFVAAVVARVEKLRVGNGVEEGVTIGPLINRTGWDKVARHVEDAITQGANRVLGAPPERPKNDWGAFFPPTVLTNINSQMLVSREETFGPVVAMQSFDDEDGVLALSNDTPYGLAAYVFSGDEQQLQRAAKRLQFGHVGLNIGSGPTPEAPFGGMRQSGFGREGGREGLLEFCETQVTASG